MHFLKNLAANAPNNNERNLPLTFVSNPDSLSGLIIFTISFISPFEIINDIVPVP